MLAALTIGFVTSAPLLAPPAVPATAAGSGTAPSTGNRAGASVVTGPVTRVSRCRGQNAETEEAVDPRLGYVYVEWMGCRNRIGFARSTNDGLSFGKPVILRGSRGAWDPSVAVAPKGTVYAAFMNGNAHHTFPVVEASFDHGRRFPLIRRLVAPARNNYGDRDFIAVGPHRMVYLTWTYGPSSSSVHETCPTSASCTETSGDINAVIQKSTDGGRTWGPIVPVSPGFPFSAADDPPLVVGPGGRIDVEYPYYPYVNRKKLRLGPGHSMFTASADRGRTWSPPVRIGSRSATIAVRTWWIDGDIGIDAGENLYVTFDTQMAGRDVGWLSYSTDRGRTWSPLRRVTPDRDDAVHIVQVAGSTPGIAYVGWLADNSPHGYALYLRPFSLTRGWLSAPVRVSPRFGRKRVWAGDTFGISALAPGSVAVSWGSALGKKKPDEIFATDVSCPSCAS